AVRPANEAAIRLGRAVTRRNCPKARDHREDSEATQHRDRRYHVGVPSDERMVAKLERDRLRGLIEPHWRRLYNFVFRLPLDRDRGALYIADVCAHAAARIDTRPSGAPGAEVWLLGIANQMLEERLPRQPEVNFD